MKLQPRVSKTDHLQGNLDAPIELVEYGDYQCPHCGRAYPIVKSIQRKMGNKLKFIFRNFPLAEMHPDATRAAVAAEIAASQGKFWEMHNLLFQNRHSLGVISLKEYAKNAGVTDKNFLTKMIDSYYGWTVRADLVEGLNKGLKDVPAFYINGEKFIEQPTLKNLKAGLENALKICGRKVSIRQKT